MSTEIVEIPALLEIKPFPALGSANYNQEAYDNGVSVPPAIERAREIVAAGRTNALATQERSVAAAESATTATDKARIATEQADAGMAYRNTTGQYAESARSSKDAAALSESNAAASASSANEDAAYVASLIDAIQGGPVASVQGKPGPNVVLTPQDIAPNPSPAELSALTEVAVRSISPKDLDTAITGSAGKLAPLIAPQLPELATPGMVVISASPKPTPTWLKMGGQYLAAAYPKTAKKVGFVGYASLTTGPDTTFYGTNQESVAIAADPGVVVTCNDYRKLKTYSIDQNGVATQWEEFKFPTSDALFQTLTLYSAISKDGNFLVISYVCTIYGDPYFYSSGTRLLKRSGDTWTHCAWIVPEVNAYAAPRKVAISDDGTDLYVTAAAWSTTEPAFKRYSRDPVTDALTDRGAPAPVMPPQTGRVDVIHCSGNKLFAAWSGVTSGLPCSAIYDRADGHKLLAQPVNSVGTSGQFQLQDISGDRNSFLFVRSYSSAYGASVVDLVSMTETISVYSSYPLTSPMLFYGDSSAVAWYNGTEGYKCQFAGGASQLQNRLNLPAYNAPFCRSFRNGQLVHGFSSNPARLTVATLAANFGVQMAYVHGNGAQATVPYFPYDYYVRSYD